VSENDNLHLGLHNQSTLAWKIMHLLIIVIMPVFIAVYGYIITVDIIIYLLKSTEQEDAHMINTRTRAGQERHRKLALTFCP